MSQRSIVHPVRLISAAALLTAACGGSNDPVDEGEVPEDTQTDDCGGRAPAFEVDWMQQGSEGLEATLVEATPKLPVVGDNSWTLELRGAEGEPLEAAAARLRVRGFMPDHDHGTNVQPSIDELLPGTYRVEPLNLFMPGFWEIQITLDNGEDPVSKAQFPLCLD